MDMRLVGWKDTLTRMTAHDPGEDSSTLMHLSTQGLADWRLSQHSDNVCVFDQHPTHTLYGTLIGCHPLL